MSNYIYLIDELDTDVNIDWWRRNREKVNEAIRRFNEWQIEKDFDISEKDSVKDFVYKTRLFGKGNTCGSFVQWQLDILDDMYRHIEYVEENYYGEVY